MISGFAPNPPKPANECEGDAYLRVAAHTASQEKQKMKKNFIAAAAAAGIITLATGTYALAAPSNPAPSSVVTTNGTDIKVMPGTGSDTLRVHFSGAEIITHESSGGLMIVKARGQLLHYRPEAYQLINGEIKPVEVHFRIEGTDQAIVEFGKSDKSAPVFLKRGAVM
jgi:hypothetical protein